MAHKLRKLYDGDERDFYSDLTGLKFVEQDGMTQQSFAEECDINTIVRRFGLDGELPVGVRMPSYGDYEGVYDFQSAMSAIVQAKEAFAEMPARVRERFGNDPAKFVEFCSDDANRAEAVGLGLVPPVQVDPAAAPAAAAAVVRPVAQ